MQRNSAAGELLPEVPTALERRWYFALLPCCFGNVFLSSFPGAVPQEACLEFTELGGDFCDESRNFKIRRRNKRSF